MPELTRRANAASNFEEALVGLSMGVMYLNSMGENPSVALCASDIQAAMVRVGNWIEFLKGEDVCAETLQYG